MLHSIGLVCVGLFWFDDLTINENHRDRPLVMRGQQIMLYPPVAYQRVIQVDKANDRLLVQTKCGGSNWFAWVPVDKVERCR